MKAVLWLATVAAAVPAPGPLALAGKHVVTTLQAQRPQVLVDGRIVWQAVRVPVPASAAAQTFYDVSVVQRLGSVRGSTSTVAFVHTAEVAFNPKCRKLVPPCGLPSFSKPLRGELWQGRPRGPYRRVHLAGRAVAADVSGADVVVATEAPSKVVLLRPHRPRLILAMPQQQSHIDAVALAGRYAAWTERLESGFFVLKVYDVRANRLAYRLGSRALFSNNVVGFDLSADGTVAFISDRSPAVGCDGGVGWASPREPKPHFLRVNAVPGAIRIGAGRFAFLTRDSCTSSDLGYAVADRAAHVEVVGPAFFTLDFDFDGRRLAYVENGAVRIIQMP